MTDTPTPADMLDAAWTYVDQGFHLIPLIGKLPARELLPLIGGRPSWKPHLTRPNSPEEIRRWFNRPGINIGALTGVSGLVFIDCDTTQDAEWWSRSYPETAIATKTARGVQFGYQVHPDDCSIRNRSGLFGRKIDLRGWGGYVVLPPSLHPCGVRYEKIGTWQLVDVPDFDPAWIERRPEFSDDRETPRPRAAEEVERSIRTIVSIAGQRGHDACFRSACTIAEARLPFDQAMVILRSWNAACAFPPWSEKELLHKMSDAFRKVRARIKPAARAGDEGRVSAPSTTLNPRRHAAGGPGT